MGKRLEIESLGLFEKTPEEIKEILKESLQGTSIVIEKTGYNRRHRELALGPRISDLTEQGIDLGNGKEHQYRISYQPNGNGTTVRIYVGSPRSLENRKPANYSGAYRSGSTSDRKPLKGGGIEHFNGEAIDHED